MIFRDTYVERLKGETSNDRSDRAIRVATQWYDEHLKRSQQYGGNKNTENIRVVLITDDFGNREKAKASGILTASSEEYISSLTDHLHLKDKLSKKSFETDNEKIGLFPPHMSIIEIQSGIKSKRLLQGSFMASRDNYLEGSVNVEGYDNVVCFKYLCFSKKKKNVFFIICLLYFRF